MTQADRVLSTPPTDTSAISTSAPSGAVQLSSPPVILTSHAPAGQGVKNEPEPSRGSAIQECGAVVSRRSVMNMLVSTAIAGTAVPAESPSDPIFALIEEHKKANADYYAAVAEVVPGTLSPDPEKEELYGNREGAVRWTLTSTTPTTLAGLLALLSYIEGVSDGSCSPNGKGDCVFQHADDEMFNVIVGASECLAAHLTPIAN